LPRRVGVFEINLEKLFELAPDVVTAAELRVMPAATQDLSLVVNETIAAGEILATLKSGAGELLESVVLVDDYRGANLPEGKKSLTFNLVFRASDRTLTQAEATAAKESAIELANKTHGAEIRS
jgi:phenylalanyl-tRNA synthetase beta chain